MPSSTPAFKYRAATTSGDVVEGVLRAASSREALDALRRQTLVPVSVEPLHDRRFAFASLRRSRSEAVATSLRTLATLVSAGQPLDRALDFARAHAAHAEVGAALAHVLADVRAGAALSSSLREQHLFGAFAAAVVLAGEESGTLGEALARVAEHFERGNELSSQVRAALLYPMLMGGVAGIAIIVLLAFVVPRFVAILGDVGGTLPFTTRLLVGASNVIAGGWWVWIPLVAVAVLGARAWLAYPGNRRRFHAARLRFPVSGELERSIATARFARALSVLLRSGAAALTALRVAREGVTNDALGARFDEAALAVNRGERIAEALGQALPPLAAQLLAVGEESGRLDELAARAADTYETESERALRTLVRLVEPALIIVFGVVVGFVALAMLQAVYSINAGII